MNARKRTAGLICVCDHHGRIVEVKRNDLPLRVAPRPGALLTTVVEPASLSKTLDFLLQLSEKGSAFDWEVNVPFRRPDEPDTIATVLLGGVRMQENLLVLVTRSHAGVLLDELSILNNELVNLQREVSKKNAELAKLNELKNQFLGMAAHDLRSPLDINLMYSGFLMDEASGDLSDEHREFLSIIRSSSRYMLGLVNDLLDVSVIESGNLYLDREPTDLTELTRHAVHLNRILAEKKGVHLSVRCENGIPPLLLDRGRIEQVIHNLLTNAVKFSQPGGGVRIRLAQREGSAVLSVTDKGIGIDPERLASLFDRFGQKSTRGTGGEKGTGLGLAISHRIVTEHGGRMEAESTPGEGSELRILLPLVRQEEA